jgi:hypothetical protein
MNRELLEDVQIKDLVQTFLQVFVTFVDIYLMNAPAWLDSAHIWAGVPSLLHTCPGSCEFGLRSVALAAKELGGVLTERSDGPDKGATFTLELPKTRPLARSSPEQTNEQT